ncbi:MAG: hypothetical protein MJA83_10300 [Gammaproteobacteria bacterium]|nr:hypothetical protein [Gammaproteobacteria bacterium]
MADKIGRNKVFCQRYLMERRREKNKIRKLKRHLKCYPNDAQAENALRILVQSPIPIFTTNKEIVTADVAAESNFGFIVK